MLIDDFPPEILELIFIASHGMIHPYPIASTDAPLNLSQTCKRWRDVASGIPSLWSTLRVLANHATSEPPVIVVEHWMRLSGAFPLSLSLVCQRRAETAVDSGLPSSVSRVLELFLLNMYRWKDASFDFSQHTPPIDYPASLTEQGAPQLERLEIHPFSWSPLLGALPTPWLAEVVSSAPLLHTFTSHLGKFPRAFFAQIPWGQLTHLRLETRISELACLFILQSASNLVECHFLNVRYDFPEDIPAFDPLLPATLPHLTTLGIASQIGFERLFRHLVAPELQTLEIATRSTQMQWYHTQFMAFLRRSTCSITSLILRDLFISRLDAPQLRELLTHVSDSLTHLAITSDIPGTPVGIQNSLLRELAYRPTGLVLCPQLERLALHLGVSTTDGELGSMLESRWVGHRQAPGRIARLQAVDIVCATDTHPVDVRRLHALLAQGLEGKIRMLNEIQTADGSIRRRSFT
ncbi:hypothetical protein B0H17DRAFT_1034866 [Mycena rosella]|uniref:F-box domain-containing protein n=1 Tax=Mycena rosella TaxID=1033263 RepID=A0AAD7GWP9_MYCRO|nr:hypothetical protein B0H17DRAFT_1034866 [Mycena rosella]